MLWSKARRLLLPDARRMALFPWRAVGVRPSGGSNTRDVNAAKEDPS